MEGFKMSKREKDIHNGIMLLGAIACLVYYTPKVIYLVFTILNLNK